VLSVLPVFHKISLAGSRLILNVGFSSWSVNQDVISVLTDCLKV